MTMGDPAGIGPEVLLKVLAHQNSNVSLSVIADLSWLKFCAGRLRLRIPWSRYRWINAADVPARFSVGKIQPAAGRAAHACVEEAVRLLRGGEVDGLVTAPVSKEAIVRAGIRWIGHTEFLGESFHVRTVMMFISDSFRVSLVTTHVPVRRLSGLLTKEKARFVIRMTREALLRDFGVRNPKIGLCALNPHGGEGGIFGDEEARVLRPAARSFGGSLKGPLPADSLIKDAMEGQYDAVVAIYHDQALIPLKLKGWNRAVNVTLGLPFMRTSPVHGTAFDIAGKGKADAGSMLSALDLAHRLSVSRATRQ